jgi:hypothetical protein
LGGSKQRPCAVFKFFGEALEWRDAMRLIAGVTLAVHRVAIAINANELVSLWNANAESIFTQRSDNLEELRRIASRWTSRSGRPWGERQNSLEFCNTDRE